ncbi:MAG: hypothetical protein WAT91_07490 [Saprospiraceae bacterium]
MRLRNTILFFMLLAMLFVSCKRAAPTVSNEPAPKEIQPKSIPQKFKGQWVNLKYIESLKRTKSPSKSQDVAYLSFVTIDQNMVSSVWNFHEGTSDSLTLISDNEIEAASKARYRLVTPEKLLSTTDKGVDTLFRFDMIEKNEFSNRAINEFVFKGNYSDGNTNVEFTSDGKIKGLDAFDTYAALQDYYDAGLNLDKLLLYKGNTENEFTWDFKGDKLIIYTIECKKFDKTDSRCVVLKRGKKAFTLTRK